MKEIIILFSLLVSGCVFPGDIEQLKHSQDIYQYKVNTALDSMRDGSKDVAQTIGAIKSAQSERDREIDNVVREVTQRTEAAISAAQGGLSLAEAGGLSGLVTVVGGVALNVMRNRSRKEELETIIKNTPG